MARTLTPTHRAAISAAKTGHKHSAETRLKIGAAMSVAHRASGHQPSAEARAKALLASAKAYLVTSPDGVQHRVVNLSAFCRENGLNPKHMHRVASGDRPQHKGW